MLDWGALIGESETVEDAENSPPSGELPHCFPPVSETVGKAATSNDAAYKAISPLSPPSPLENKGGRLETENETRVRGGATVKFSDEKTHPVSPLAVCLLLACCDRIKADEQETIEALMMLKLSTPTEQVRAWAMLCNENGIDPSQVLHPSASGESLE